MLRKPRECESRGKTASQASQASFALDFNDLAVTGLVRKRHHQRHHYQPPRPGDAGDAGDAGEFGSVTGKPKCLFRNDAGDAGDAALLLDTKSACRDPSPIGCSQLICRRDPCLTAVVLLPLGYGR